MKTCPNCHNQISDESVYCPVCGSGISVAPQYQHQPEQHPYMPYNTDYTQPPIHTEVVPYTNPYNHTADYDAADISENKVVAMLVYLLGPLGIVIALMAAGSSKYAAFHARQGMKLTIVEILAGLGSALLVFLTAMMYIVELGVFVAAVMILTLIAIRIICFLQVANSKAIEPFIVRSLPFLK